MYGAILGAEHPNTLTSLNNLAVTCYYLGELSRAEELLTKAYTLRCKVLGEQHPDTQLALRNLTAVRKKLEEQ